MSSWLDLYTSISMYLSRFIRAISGRTNERILFSGVCSVQYKVCTVLHAVQCKVCILLCAVQYKALTRKLFPVFLHSFASDYDYSLAASKALIIWWYRNPNFHPCNVKQRQVARNLCQLGSLSHLTLSSKSLLDSTDCCCWTTQPIPCNPV